MVKVIVGLQWGNEGKDRIIQKEARQAKVVVKCTGGENDENVVIYNGRQYVTHLLPASIFQKDTISILANDVALNLSVLTNELTMLQQIGVKVTRKNLWVSDQERVIMPWHIKVDQVLKNNYPRGSYIPGISSCYQEKGDAIILADLFDHDRLFSKMNHSINLYRKILKKVFAQFDLEKICSEYCLLGQQINQFVVNTYELLFQMLQEEQVDVLLEGANKEGIMCVSSNTHDICRGAGISLSNIDEVIGVIKAYVSKCANGAFPTEIRGKLGETLQKEEDKYLRGKSFSRCGWLDLVMLRHNIVSNEVTHLAMNGMAAITKMKEAKLCIAYDYKHLITRKLFPPDLDKCIAYYGSSIFPACNTSKCRRWDELPVRAREYVRKVQQCIDIPIKYVGVGEDNVHIIRCPKEISVF